MPVPSMGFPSLRRFLPVRSPKHLSAPRLLLAVIPLARHPASRMSASVGRVATASWVSTRQHSLLPWSFHSPSRSFPSGLAPRFRVAPLMGFSSCSSECQRTRRSARLAPPLPPWGSCRARQCRPGPRGCVVARRPCGPTFQLFPDERKAL